MYRLVEDSREEIRILVAIVGDRNYEIVVRKSSYKYTSVERIIHRKPKLLHSNGACKGGKFVIDDEKKIIII